MARKPTYEELEQRVKELGREFLERKQAEKALRESEERYWEITSSIPGVVYQFLLKKDGSYSSPYISESASSILDISAKEAIANPYSLFDKIVKDDLDSVNQSIAESARTMEKWSQEFRIKTKTGEIRWMRATSIPHLLPNGEILWNGAILDISDRMQAQEALQRAHDELERRVEERAAELVGANKQLRAEIEERKQSQESLRESEEKYKTLTESSLTGIYIHQDGRYVFVNDRFAQIHGYRPKELLGEHYLTLIHPDETGRIKQIKSKRLKGEPAPRRYEVKRLRKDGEAVWCATIAVRIEYRGKPAIMGNIADINEHKLAEEELRASEAQKKAILDASIDRIRLADKDMRIIWANKTTVRELNMPPEDLEGEFCYKIFSDRHTPCPDCQSKKAFKSGNIEHAILYRPKLKDIEGETYWDAYAVPIKDESGDIVNMIEIARNITEQMQGEEALRESEERFRTFAEAAPYGLSIMRPDKTFEYLNPRFTEIFGYTSEDIPDKYIWFEKAYPDKEYRDTVISVWKQYFAEDFDGGQIEPNIFKVRCKDGQDKIIHFRNVISDDGRHFLTYEDITAQAKAEEALRERETELEIKTNSLEEMNTALRVLLERRDEDKTELEEKVLVNVRELVLPFLEKVKKTPLDPRQLSYIHILESNLNDIISPFMRNLSTKYVNLTPTEIRVAHLIREGKTTKEIGEVMALSPRTIETHRKNMRKKLGIEKNKGNLRSHLLSLQ